MKTKIKLLMSTIALLLFLQKAYSQSDIAGVGTGHVRVNGYYVGWDNTGAIGPLNIRNDFNQPIDFSTNTFQRMYIAGGGANFGFVGIGSNVPTSKLHINALSLTTPGIFRTDGR